MESPIEIVTDAPAVAEGAAAAAAAAAPTVAPATPPVISAAPAVISAAPVITSADPVAGPPAPGTPERKNKRKDGEQKETTKAALAEKFSQASLLDMVFVMDCTGSMGSYIASAQATIAEIVQQIVSTEKADVRFALIAYRDHPPQESTYVTNVYDFSTSVKTMRTNLDQLSANGGGDGPEAVVDGLHAASKLDYRSNATKVVILIADAPPHGLDPSGDGFPNGCPCGLDPMVVCRQMAEQDIALYCIGCEPSLTRYKNFFMAMAHVTGGQYCPLGDAHVLSSAVVSGVREEMSLAAALAEVKVAVEACGEMDEKAQAEFVHSKLKQSNVRSKQMKHDGSGTASAINDDAIAMSKLSSLEAIRGKYTLGDTHGSFDGSSLPYGSLVMAVKSPRRRATPASAPAPVPTGGLLGSVRRFFGMPGAASASDTAHGDEEDEAAALDSMDTECMSSAALAPARASAAPIASCTPSSYRVEEADISMEQTARLMNKARFQSAVKKY